MAAFDLSDPNGLERFLLPDVYREGDVFEAMLDGVERQLTHLTETFESLKKETEWPQEAADMITDEGATVAAMQLDIAEIALTGVFHWIERRCTALLGRKAKAAGESQAAVEKLMKAKFGDKVQALKDRGVDLASLQHFSRH